MENNTFNVAVLGAGNIGSAVITRLIDLDKGIVGLNVKKVLVKDKSKKRPISADILVDKFEDILNDDSCLLYTSPSPRDTILSRMPSSA